MPADETYKTMICPIILDHLPNVKIIIYGSRARGDHASGSDIDIALNAGKLIDNTIMTNIYFDLEDSDLPIKYDLVDFHEVSERMQKEIEKDGVVWSE